jgi:hypothetical protein
MISTTLLQAYDCATDTQIANGCNWYATQNLVIQQAILPYRYVTLSNAVACVARLSPSVSWLKNLENFHTLLDCLNYSDSLVRMLSVSIQTYNLNKLKAIQCLYGDITCVAETYDKTRNSGMKIANFAHNLLKPSDRSSVTIDRHAYRVWLGNKFDHKKSITPSIYRIVSQDYLDTAKYLDLIPCEFQAILWVAYREKQGISQKYD